MKNVSIAIASLAMFLSCTTMFGQAEHERLTGAAWAALKANEYLAAITNAETCIEEFKITAENRQVELQKAGKAIPEGAVSDDVKKTIFANGPLNDVSTCYFILGEANRKLMRSEPSRVKAAKAAYEAARALTHGRSWDTNGWFWVPSKAASERLQVLPSVSSRQ